MNSRLSTFHKWTPLMDTLIISTQRKWVHHSIWEILFMMSIYTHQSPLWCNYILTSITIDTVLSVKTYSMFSLMFILFNFLFMKFMHNFGWSWKLLLCSTVWYSFVWIYNYWWILLLIEIWVVSDLGLLQIALLWTFIFMYSFMYLETVQISVR